MSETAPRPRRRAFELAVCAAIVLGISAYALWRMDYLAADTAHHVRMTDSTRTAYVAKNIAEGRGYTTNELPAFLLAFYDQQGKLHDADWVNADRFPFTAYAVAGLYKVTGSTSEQVGLLAYNLIFFVAFLVVLYWFTRQVWDDRWSAMLALALALLHPLTYVYLYLKDADMMLLSVGIMAVFYGYFQKPPEAHSWKRYTVMGTLLAWMFLNRPNIGGAFILYLGIVILRRLWVARRDRGVVGAIRDVARREGIAVAAIIVWCLPFMIHSLSEWGSPFFSANALYQQPLGTRFAMNTDTWWKYSDPTHVYSLQTLLDGAPGDVVKKFTTSWWTTIKTTIPTWALEFLLAGGLLAWLARRKPASGEAATAEHPDRARPVRRLAGMVGFAVLVNLLLLPLYGYQNYGYRHYLSFFLPLIWLCAGRAIVLLVERARPAVTRAGERFRANPAPVILVLALVFLVLNFSRAAQDANQLGVPTSKFVAKHWLAATLILAAAIWHRPLLRAPAYPRVLLGLLILVLARYQPNLETKRLNFNWFPADTKVWDTLRERKGLVMSFAMQGEVNWVSGRKNIPAPELPMHVYSFLLDHRLEVEDVYIESAEVMMNQWDGPFYYAAPGFESYVRLQKYQARLPGYQVVFHAASTRDYMKYSVKPRAKASTVYRLVDRAAVQAMLRGPDRIELGSVDDVIYTAHGWGDYYTIDGKPVVAATDVTNARYTKRTEKPWEDTSVTFFLDERPVRSVELEVYGTHDTTLDFYWNLDLYAYDRPRDRAKHHLGSFRVTQGWQRIRIDVPQGMTRVGLNKLGFKTAGFQPLVICPTSIAELECSQVKLALPPMHPDLNAPLRVLRAEGAARPVPMRAALFAGTLQLHY